MRVPWCVICFMILHQALCDTTEQSVMSTQDSSGKFEETSSSPQDLKPGVNLAQVVTTLPKRLTSLIAKTVKTGIQAFSAGFNQNVTAKSLSSYSQALTSIKHAIDENVAKDIENLPQSIAPTVRSIISISTASIEGLVTIIESLQQIVSSGSFSQESIIEVTHCLTLLKEKVVEVVVDYPQPQPGGCWEWIINGMKDIMQLQKKPF